MKMRTRRGGRGGLWLFRKVLRSRSAYRSLARPSETDECTGFRVVCLPREVAPLRVPLRGGSWDNISGGCRSAYRDHGKLCAGYDDIGFRVICLPPT